MVLAYLLLAPEMMAVPAVLSTPWFPTTHQLRKDCLHITSTKHRQTLNLNDMFGHSSSAFLPVCQTESSAALPSCGAVSTTQRSNASACHREDEIDAWLIFQFQSTVMMTVMIFNTPLMLPQHFGVEAAKIKR